MPFTVLPKIEYHLLFIGYINLITQKDDLDTHYSFTIHNYDCFYSRFQDNQAISAVAARLMTKSNETGCEMYNIDQNQASPKIKYEIDKDKFSNYINSYIANLISNNDLVPDEENKLDCSQLVPFQRQLEIISEVLEGLFKNNGNEAQFFFEMLEATGGPGTETYKRFCIDELFTHLLLTNKLESVDVQRGKNHYDQNFQQHVEMPFYNLKRKSIIRRGKFWYDLIKNEIGYSSTGVTKKLNPVKPKLQTELLKLLITTPDAKLSADNLLSHAKTLKPAYTKKQLQKLLNDVDKLIAELANNTTIKIIREPLASPRHYYLP